jgi:hypothetical protein
VNSSLKAEKLKKLEEPSGGRVEAVEIPFEKRVRMFT